MTAHNHHNGNTAGPRQRNARTAFGRSMSTTEVALTAHIRMGDGHPADAVIPEICNELEQDFQIHHATIQVEISEVMRSALAPEDVV